MYQVSTDIRREAVMNQIFVHKPKMIGNEWFSAKKQNESAFFLMYVYIATYDIKYARKVRQNTFLSYLETRLS